MSLEEGKKFLAEYLEERKRRDREWEALNRLAELSDEMSADLHRMIEEEDAVETDEGSVELDQTAEEVDQELAALEKSIAERSRKLDEYMRDRQKEKERGK